VCAGEGTVEVNEEGTVVPLLTRTHCLIASEQPPRSNARSNVGLSVSSHTLHPFSLLSLPKLYLGGFSTHTPLQIYAEESHIMSSLSRRACFKCGNVGHYAGEQSHALW
jgi:hypothetical protein